jgi:DNA-binding helix-hairpin-helix protein with protein kinase domain
VSKTSLYTSDGAPIRLAGLVGKGGEGAVYEVAGPAEVSLAVKLYSAGASERAPKIEYMVTQKLAERVPLAAFPLQAVTTREGRVVGFLMKLVRAHKPLYELVSPGARKRHFPDADYRFLVHTAANLARSVASLHQHGCVIGDINHAGVLVSDKATVGLIDADSFQICNGAQKYLCRVGVPEYTPPELQGQHLGSVIRTPNHDAFGLAVSIFQLLWMGRHPFAGVPAVGEMPTPQAIKEGKFPYARAGCPGLGRPPSAPKLDDFPPSLADAFERAFLRKQGARPTAAEWIDILGQTESSLKKCAKNDRHFYPSGASECLWCRVEHTQGVFLFPTASPTITVADPGAINFRLDAVWATISSIAAPSAAELPHVSAQIPGPSSEAVEARKKASGTRLWAASVLFVAAAVLVIYPAAWFVWLAAGWWGWAQVAKPAAALPMTFKKRAQELDLKWENALQEWRQRPRTQFDRVLSELRDIKNRYETLASREAAEIARVQERHRGAELLGFLQRQLIGHYAIVGVGPGRLATLNRYGVRNAADATESRLLSIPGFGPSLAAPVLLWRRRLEQQFRPSGGIAAAEATDIQSIKLKFAREASELRSKLSAGALRLRQVSSLRTANIDPVLNHIHQARMQAHADARYLGIDLAPRVVTPVRPRPAQPPVVPTRPSSTTSRAKQTRATTAPKFNITPPQAVHVKGALACPHCGGPMVRRTARRGRNRGNQFWGCSRYFSTGCTGTRPV